MTKLARLATFAITVFSSAVLLTTPAAAATTISSYSASAFAPLSAGVSLIIILCMCVIGLLLLGIKIYLIVDALNRNYGSDQNMMLVGILFLLFIPFPIAEILYWVMIMQKYPKKK